MPVSPGAVGAHVAVDAVALCHSHRAKSIKISTASLIEAADPLARVVSAQSGSEKAEGTANYTLDQENVTQQPILGLFKRLKICLPRTLSCFENILRSLFPRPIQPIALSCQPSNTVYVASTSQNCDESPAFFLELSGNYMTNDGKADCFEKNNS